MNASVAAIGPDTDPAQIRIFCEYNDRYGNGPSIALSFLTAGDDAAAQAKLQQVKAIGANEACWDSRGDVPRTFFVEGYWDGSDYVKGFVDATGLPARLFELLDESCQGDEDAFEPLRFYLKDVDPAALIAHLEKCGAFRADTKMAEVIEAEALVVRTDGAIKPIWEKTDDDGKIQSIAVTLPENGKELVEALYLDQLDDDLTFGAKP